MISESLAATMIRGAAAPLQPVTLSADALNPRRNASAVRRREPGAATGSDSSQTVTGSVSDSTAQNSFLGPMLRC